MALRVDRRIRLAGKTARLNIGKRGPTSVSLILFPGLTLNFNPDGIMATLGLHGTGVSYRTERKKLPARRKK
jgi:hypothetical protein